MISPLDAHREQLVRLLELVQREQARRRGYVGDPVEELLAIYDRMEANLRAAGWRPPYEE